MGLIVCVSAAVSDYLNTPWFFLSEPVREKTNNLGFRPGPTQTGLYSHRKWLEAGSFGFRKKRDCIIHVAKAKALIS